MKVRDIMEKNVISVRPDTKYEEVAKILFQNNISGVPVVDENEKIVGFISEKDIFRILYPRYDSFYAQPEAYADLESREKKAEEIKNHRADVFMTKMPVLVGPDDPVMKAGALMLAKKVSRIPVVEAGRIVGIISRKMIYRAILKESFGL
jgi:CBS domain-containing protein